MGTTASDQRRMTGKWVLVSATTASAMAFIDGSALNVVLPSLQKDLGATATDLLWIINAYLLFLAALILPGGTLGDRIGRKKVFMWGISLFVLASLSCGLAPSATWLIVSRGAQGIGGALMVPGSLSVISAYFQKEERGKAIGTWSAVTTMVTVIGPALGGFLADLGWWRAIFFLNLPLGLLSLLSLYYKVPESKDEEANKSIDWTGAALIVVGLGSITFAFISAPEYGWKSSIVLATLLTGITCLVFFVWVEKRLQYPMVPLKLFRNRTFTGANLITLLLYGALNMALFLLVLNLVQVQEYSQLQAGLATLPFGLMLILFSRKMGALAARYGPKWFLVAGSFLAGISFILLGMVDMALGFERYWTSYLPGVLVLGIGMAVTVAPLTTAVMSSVEDRFVGTASGVNNAVSRAAGVLSIAILGAVAVASFTNEVKESIHNMALSAAVQVEVLKETENLGAATVPKNVGAAQKEVLRKVFDTAFVEAYELVLFACAALAFGAAIAAFFIIPSSSHVKDEVELR
ncbi:MFS transporter [Pontibacter locisalis]|uniref:MFS transporter n=1 Tax=Pontibacter locisalis TaxID=1719035 RepID=A0ABW5IGN8_9BACT